MTLETREPTGAVPWPLILVEGGEKSGKSWAAAVLTASNRVGRSYWLDFAEGSGDEYGAIPGVRYKIVKHDGTFDAIHQAVVDVHAEAVKARAAKEKPLVLVIDTMTAEWDLLKEWANLRARRSKKNQALLAKDPNAEIVVSTNYWNDANSRHRKIMKVLMAFPGIVIMVARGGVTALIENGAPVEGKKSYAVEGQKRLAFDASVWVRLSKDHKPMVIGARNVHSGIRPGIDDPQPLDDDWTLDQLVFDLLRCDPDTAHVRDLVDPVQDVLPEDIRDEAVDPATRYERVRELYTLAKTFLTAEVTNESGGDEALGDLLIRIGTARQAAAAAKASADAADSAWVEGKPEPEPEPEPSPARAELANLEAKFAAPADDVNISPRSIELFKAITDATDLDVLKAVWGQVLSALNAEEITRAQHDQLLGHTKHRKAALQPAAPVDVPMVNQNQHRHMEVLWSKNDLGGEGKRAERLAKTAEIIGRTIVSRKELTFVEAMKIIDYWTVPSLQGANR